MEESTTEFPEPPRVVDKRGQNKGNAAPLAAEPVLTDEDREQLAEAMAQQGVEAEAEAAAEPAVEVDAFMLVCIDSTGAMQMYHESNAIAEIMRRGVSAKRQATPVDIINMASQLHMAVTGNDLTGRVIEALSMQAQRAVAERIGANGGLSVAQGVAHGAPRRR